jgi:hypothetical protein
VFGMVLWALRRLLPMKANGAVAVDAPDVLWSGLQDVRHRHILPTLFVQSVGLVKFALLATDHEITRHVPPILGTSDLSLDRAIVLALRTMLLSLARV